MLCTLKCRDITISHEDALVQRPEKPNSVPCKEISSEFNAFRISSTFVLDD